MLFRRTGRAGQSSPSSGPGPSPEPITELLKDLLEELQRRKVATRPPRDWIQISVTALPGLAAVIALIFTWLSITATNDQLQINEQGQITDRYNSAITNLGSSSVDNRLGGIYALQRIMLDSPRDQPTVVAVLCAFVRNESSKPVSDEPYPAVPSPSPAPSPEASAAGVPRQLPADVQAALNVVDTRNIARDGSVTVVDFSSTYLNNAYLSGARLSGAHLYYAHLSYANLTGADLTGADLLDTDLTDASITGAHLSRADLGFTRLTGADLTGVDLTGANLTGAEASDVIFTGGALGGADLNYADLTGVDLTHADLANANLSHAHVHYANLSGANLTGANLSGADLTQVNFTGANLTGANLTGADLAGAKFTGVRGLPAGTPTKAPAGFPTAVPGGLCHVSARQHAKGRSVAGRGTRMRNGQLLPGSDEADDLLRATASGRPGPHVRRLDSSGQGGTTPDRRLVRVSEQPDPASEWWTTSDVAAYLGLKVATVSAYRTRGQMPQPDMTVGRTHVWRPDTIIKWHRARKRVGVGGRPTVEQG